MSAKYHTLGEDCDICGGRGFDFIGRPCRLFGEDPRPSPPALEMPMNECPRCGYRTPEAIQPHLVRQLTLGRPRSLPCESCATPEEFQRGLFLRKPTVNLTIPAGPGRFT